MISVSTLCPHVHVLLYTLLLNLFGEERPFMSEDIVDMSKINGRVSNMSKIKNNSKTFEKVFVGAYII